MAPFRGTEPARVLRVVAPGEGGDWTAALGAPDLAVRTVPAESPAEVGAALRDPFDLVVVLEDQDGRAEAVETLMTEARCPVRLVSVARSWPAGRVDHEIRSALAAAEVAMRNGLAERISHDLSNLLAPIPLALQLLRPEPGGGGSALDAVDSSTRRAMAAARDLSSMLTAAAGEPVRVCAKHPLILAARAWSDRRVLTDYPPALGRIVVRVMPLGQALWCCARRELDRVGSRAGAGDGAAPEAGDLVFEGRNADGAVDLRVGWVGPPGEETPLAERAVCEISAGAGLDALASAVTAQRGELALLADGGRPAGFRLRLPVHEC